MERLECWNLAEKSSNKVRRAIWKKDPVNSKDYLDLINLKLVLKDGSVVESSGNELLDDKKDRNLHDWDMIGNDWEVVE